MKQDFAKIKPKHLLERKTFKLPPTWSLLLTGGLILITSAKALDQGPDNLPSNNTLDVDFYTELPTNSVPVPLTPMPSIPIKMGSFLNLSRCNPERFRNYLQLSKK